MGRTLEKTILAVVIVAVLALGSLFAVAVIQSPSDEVKSPAVDSYQLAQANEPTPTITAAQASQIAQSTIVGTVSEVELQRLNGRDMYAVEIMQGAVEYGVFVDATTGAIVKIEREDDVGRSELELVATEITPEHAQAIAQSVVKGIVNDVEVEKLNGDYVYVVEFEDDEKETEVIIDMMTGAVLDIEEEFEDQQAKADIKTGSVTEDEAIAIAQEQVGPSFSFDEVEVISRGGEPVYEIDFEGRNQEAEVLISKEGNVLGVEYEED